MAKYFVIDIHCPEISPYALVSHITQKSEDDHCRVELDRDMMRKIGEMADW